MIDPGGLLDVLSTILAIALLAAVLGAGAVVAALLMAASGGGAADVPLHQHELRLHERWVAERMRQRYLARRRTGEATHAEIVAALRSNATSRAA
jgi:hypothetical protein